MNGIHAEAERLSNGMEAVFVHQPHWQTNSARLIVNAGTLHEEESAPTGVAHFFEHVTFQGTADFPDIEALDEYKEERFVSTNASTSKNRTVYMADCREGLDPALKIVTQLALTPTLDSSAVERERGAIIDEARGYQFDPTYQAQRTQLEALAGKRYAALGTGTIEEVAAITHEDILKFYKKHYRAANMLLIICGSEPVEVQREKASELIAETSPTDQSSEPTLWQLPWLSGDLRMSAVQSDLPPDSQTNLSVQYRTPSHPDLKENLILNIAGGILSINAHRRLRRELSLTYGASGETFYLQNSNFGANERYGTIFTQTSTNGEGAFRCLDELLQVVPESAANDTRTIELVVRGLALSLRDQLQQPPHEIANAIPDSTLFTHERVMDPQKLLAHVDNIAISEVQEIIRDITAEPALIQITSPDETILDRAQAYDTGDTVSP